MLILTFNNLNKNFFLSHYCLFVSIHILMHCLQSHLLSCFKFYTHLKYFKKFSMLVHEFCFCFLLDEFNPNCLSCLHFKIEYIFLALKQLQLEKFGCKYWCFFFTQCCYEKRTYYVLNFDLYLLNVQLYEKSGKDFSQF